MIESSDRSESASGKPASNGRALAVIALVCAVLSFLQYRWTGELSRAEPALLRAGLNDQLRRLAQAFNNEIRESCTAFARREGDSRTGIGRSSQNSLRAVGRRRTTASLFTRIGVAAPEQGKLSCTGWTAEARLPPWSGRRIGTLCATPCCAREGIGPSA